jgi:putative NIF3 family GTP cyclohydrolase 1 type 2
VSATVGDVEAAIAERFPLVRAEAWDRNGLIAGDRDREVTGIRLALDPTPGVIQRAAAAGQNVVVTHHPAALDMPAAIVAGPGVAGVVFAAIDAGVALLNAHTNLDRDPVGQQRLPELLGLDPIAPLETGLVAMSLVTTYVPRPDTERVISAMAEAGAGRIGDYTGCSFSSEGEGRFTVPPAANPQIGTPGASETVREERVEMVCAPDVLSRVVAACTAGHPYEEPLVTVTDCRMARNSARLGMLSRIGAGATLESLVERCTKAFGTVPRVWGDASITVATVATATGSAGSLISEARSRGADVLVAGEVRYHDAMAAGELAVIELGHDVSEWPLVGVLADAVRQTPGVDPAQVIVESAAYGWWTPTNRTDEER